MSYPINQSSKGKKPDKVNILYGISILLIAGFCLFAVINSTSETKEEKETRLENEWFISGSDISCENNLKGQLRDPNSYERYGDFNTIANDGGRRIVEWKFRAKNGFDGYTPEIGWCLVTKENSSITAKVKSN